MRLTNLFGKKFAIGVLCSILGIGLSFLLGYFLLLDVVGLILLLLSLMDSFMSRTPDREHIILKKFLILLFFIIVTVVKLLFF